MKPEPQLPPFEIHDFPHELVSITGYPHPNENTDMLDGEYIFPDPSEETFTEDLETYKEVH